MQLDSRMGISMPIATACAMSNMSPSLHSRYTSLTPRRKGTGCRRQHPAQHERCHGDRIQPASHRYASTLSLCYASARLTAYRHSVPPPTTPGSCLALQLQPSTPHPTPNRASRQPYARSLLPLTRSAHASAVVYSHTAHSGTGALVPTRSAAPSRNPNYTWLDLQLHARSAALRHFLYYFTSSDSISPPQNAL